MRLRKRLRKGYKKTSRAVRYWFGRQMLRLGLFLIPLFPLAFIVLLASFAGKLAWYLRGKDRRLAFANMELAFPSLTDEEKTSISKTAARNLLKNLLELAWINGHPDLMPKLVELEGMEHIQNAAANGKGVVVISAHLGNFMLLCLRLAMECDGFSVVINIPPDKGIAAMLRSCHARFSMNPINRNPQWASFRESLRRLKKDEVICLIADEEARKGGVFVDFFGHLVPTPKGPAALAIRSGATVVPAFAYHLPEGRQKVVVHPPLRMPEGYTDEHIQEGTAVFTKTIEEAIREHPEEWAWINNRWRKRLTKTGP
ncbi:hypothetical protein J7M28_00790 [bacterium]|nr:hypothetical protein [bacterium]